MPGTKTKESITKYKIFYTIIILLVYMLGQRIPLYGVDVSAYSSVSVNAEKILMQTIGGDIHRFSIFAIGISPYMLSSMFVHIVMAFRSADSKAGISPKKINQISLILTFLLSTVQALFHMGELKFADTVNMLPLVKLIAVSEMITGVMVVVWLAGRNKKYGIGGQTALIYINILEGIMSTLGRSDGKGIIVLLLIAIIGMEIIIIMENAEKRIPVQRISIHNIYADKNYLAIKLNPIGVMPMMFSTAFFMLPQMLLFILNILFPEQRGIIWWRQNMTLTRPLGIAVYIICLYLLTIGFSMIFINPEDMTEQFLKSGDCIQDVYAGNETKKYLTGVICRLSFFSATVMGICAGVPLLLQLKGNIDNAVVMLPTSIMMLTGIWCNLYREIMAIRKYDTCQPFL